MDFFNILIAIVVLIGPAIGKSLKDKGKIERERPKKIETVPTKTNHKKYHVPKENLDTRMNVEKQNLFRENNYEDSPKRENQTKNYNYTLNESRHIEKELSKQHYNSQLEISKKDIPDPILEFTKNDIVKGVIMLELLGKPKSLTRR